ncbi:unnamed protein product [Microthlaspi erraticum]|uniref:Neprosin PEP catalytic domain-containing protein n=1 Tax=Microthlaspi erraticum TaxID=1685480 RepID=A0A6D2LAY7_9BRAS|nr:unnamed protein product [Microthlaspi erraticum]CAA7037466.1 unnamed protein product [Microthlaspi erraticum]CAA7061395.1 unnamed protein product [Microthlaspi erraticum]
MPTMGSSNGLVLLILLVLTISLTLVADASQKRREIPSEEEMIDLKRQLKAINKPALKSFKTEHGYIFDCIEMEKQLAFDHPLLKNHSIQLKPTSIPKWTSDNTTSKRSSSSLPFGQDDITCPLGTVIVKRTTLEELIPLQRLKSVGFFYPSSKNKNADSTNHFAAATYKRDTYGALGNINVWEPHVSSDQFSYASISVARGSGNQLQSISAGWIVYELLNKKHSVLFTYWTTDGFQKTGCYNTLCPGFVQVSRKFALGALAKPVSTYNGQQYHLEVGLYQDSVTGDWWFLIKDERIGYLPRSLFNDEGLANGASIVFWGGEVFSSVKEKSPSMGSGHFPFEGYKKAAYVNGLKVIDHQLAKVIIPPPTSIQLLADSPHCYDAEKEIGKGDWSRAIFFGGPGGCTF